MDLVLYYEIMVWNLDQCFSFQNVRTELEYAKVFVIAQGRLFENNILSYFCSERNEKVFISDAL